MRQCSFFLIVLCSLMMSVFSVRAEELYIVPDGPAVVGGGIVRYFDGPTETPVSVDYVYGGTSGADIIIEKVTTSPVDKSRVKEFFMVRPEKHGIGKKAFLRIGSHTIQLKVAKDGRLIVKKLE